MGFIDELKRRNVFRVASLYIVGAWLIIQIANNIFPAFAVPTWVYRTIIIVLAIGFIPAMAISWAFEITPKGLKRGSKVKPSESIASQTARRLNILLICSLVIALGYFMVDKFVLRHAAITPPIKSSQTALNASKTSQQPSIAVLPFDNRSALADDAFFADGMQDDILTQLSKISGLKVISRTSVEKFRDTNLSIKEIANLLDVKTILEGGVQRGGNKVRINMQLINAENDSHLWAEIYDRELSAENIFAIQTEVTTAISDALKTKLTDGEKSQIQKIPTKNLEAWEAYQIGKQRLVNRNTKNINEAELFFRKAIKLDPTFVNAYAALINTLTLKVTYNGADTDEILAITAPLLKKAQSLGPNNAEVLTVAAAIDQFKRDYKSAEEKLRQAIKLDPNYVLAYQWLSNQLSLDGNNEQAISLAQKALALDPLSPIVNANLSVVYENAGKFDEALAASQRASELDPTMSSAYSYQALVKAYVKNQFAEASALLTKSKTIDPGSVRVYSYQMSIASDLMEDALFYQILAEASLKDPYIAKDKTLEGKMSFYNGKFDESLNYALQAYKNDPESYWFLCILYQTQGKFDLAKAIYKKQAPEFFEQKIPKITLDNYTTAIDIATLLIKTGDDARANQLLDGVHQVISTMPLLSFFGSGLAEVEVLALRGDKSNALQALRKAYSLGWRGPDWRYYFYIDPALQSIRNEPEFKAVFADIEKDMLRQRELIKK